jgi:hypothetical protein
VPAAVQRASAAAQEAPRTRSLLIKAAGDPLTLEGSAAQPLGEVVEPRRETWRTVNDDIGEFGQGILLR